MKDFIKKNKKAMKWLLIVMAAIIIITWSQSSNEQKNQGENNEAQEVESEETDNESKQRNVIEEMMKQQEDTEEDLKPVKIPKRTSEPEGIPEIVFVKQDRYGRAYHDFRGYRNVGMFIDKYGNIKEFCFDGEVNREYGERLIPYLETIGDEGIVGKIKSEDMNKLYYYYEQLFRVDSGTLSPTGIHQMELRDFRYYGFVPDGIGGYYAVMTGDWFSHGMPPDGGKKWGADANAVRINLWLGEVLGMELPIVKE